MSEYLIVLGCILHHFIHHFYDVLHHFTISYDSLLKSANWLKRHKIAYFQGFRSFEILLYKEFNKLLLILFHNFVKPPSFLLLFCSILSYSVGTFNLLDTLKKDCRHRSSPYRQSLFYYFLILSQSGLISPRFKLYHACPAVTYTGGYINANLRRRYRLIHHQLVPDCCV